MRLSRDIIRVKMGVDFATKLAEARSCRAIECTRTRETEAVKAAGAPTGDPSPPRQGTERRHRRGLGHYDALKEVVAARHC